MMRLFGRRPPPPMPLPKYIDMCVVGGCGNAATHTSGRLSPVNVVGDWVELPLCNDCDLMPTVETPFGAWQALDWVTPDQVEEDSAYLGAPSPHADNVALPSGRSWRFVRI